MAAPYYDSAPQTSHPKDSRASTADWKRTDLTGHWRTKVIEHRKTVINASCSVSLHASIGRPRVDQFMLNCVRMKFSNLQPNFFTRNAIATLSVIFLTFGLTFGTSRAEPRHSETVEEGSPIEATLQQRVPTSDLAPENGTEEFAYSFTANDCTTGTQRFASRAEECRGLRDEMLNQDCAYSHRRDFYNQIGCARLSSPSSWWWWTYEESTHG